MISISYFVVQIFNIFLEKPKILYFRFMFVIQCSTNLKVWVDGSTLVKEENQITRLYTLVI